MEDRHVFGVCNDFCFKEDGVTPVIFEEDDPSSFFCKTERSACVFPFTWAGVEYRECTRDGSEFAWCALEVDSEGVMVGNRYGKCDMTTCAVMDEEDAPKHKEARAVFDGRVEGLILFSQESNMDPVKIDGKLGGLESEEYTLKMSSETCDNVGSGVDIGGDDIIDTLDNTSYISLEKWGVSLYGGSDNIISGSVRLEETACAEQSEDCVVARTVACANVQEGNGKTLNLTLILIISVVIFSIVLIILTVILVYCCVKRFVMNILVRLSLVVSVNYLLIVYLFRFCPRRKQPEETDSMASIDDILRDHKRHRSPLYDELSIPFIDASLPPTPKTARSANPLELLLGRKIEGSRTSLNGK